MRIVLWQNCLSPHQLPYIVHLLDDKRVDEVVVVAGETVSDARREMGWSVGMYDGMDKCKVYVHPNNKIIEGLFNERQEDSQHLFSGIRADRFVFKCLKMSLLYQLRRGIITERPNTYDFKHNIPNAKPYWMHRIRFWLQDWKYAQQIHTVFAIGNEAANYFQSLGVNWKVFPFCYCTQQMSVVEEISPNEGKFAQYLFCGSLSSWKSPITIIRGLSKIEGGIMGEVKMIGNGALYQALENEIHRFSLKDKVQLLGTIPQKEVPMYMQQADIFILPSLYDGWGAVINEALQAGCYVICSDAAGASDLILEDARLGKVFHRGNVSQLADCMTWCNEHIQEIRKHRLFRKQWADKHISGTAVARYMIDCLEKSMRNDY